MEIWVTVVSTVLEICNKHDYSINMLNIKNLINPRSQINILQILIKPTHPEIRLIYQLSTIATMTRVASHEWNMKLTGQLWEIISIRVVVMVMVVALYSIVIWWLGNLMHRKLYQSHLCSQVLIIVIVTLIIIIIRNSNNYDSKYINKVY